MWKQKQKMKKGWACLLEVCISSSREVFMFKTGEI